MVTVLPAEAINVNIIGVVLSVVCHNPVPQARAHLLVFLFLEKIELNLWKVHSVKLDITH